MTDRRNIARSIAETAWWLACPGAAIAVDHLTGGHLMWSVAGMAELLGMAAVLAAGLWVIGRIGRRSDQGADHG